MEITEALENEACFSSKLESQNGTLDSRSGNHVPVTSPGKHEISLMFIPWLKFIVERARDCQVAPHKAQVFEPHGLILILPVNGCQHKELTRKEIPSIVQCLPNSVLSNDSFLNSLSDDLELHFARGLEAPLCLSIGLFWSGWQFTGSFLSNSLWLFCDYRKSTLLFCI